MRQRSPSRPSCRGGEVAWASVAGEVQAARRRPRGGLHAGVDGRGDARPRQGRDRAHRLPLPGAGVRVGQLPRAGLQRKLAAVELKFGKSDFEKRHYALLALMCIYGIELLADNIAECRANLLEIFADYLDLDESDDLYRAASYVLSQNLVHGDALTMRTQRRPADHLRRVGLPRQGQVPAARLPLRHPHPDARLSARRARSSPTSASTRSSRRPRPTRR